MTLFPDGSFFAQLRRNLSFELEFIIALYGIEKRRNFQFVRIQVVKNI